MRPEKSSRGKNGVRSRDKPEGDSSRTDETASSGTGSRSRHDWQDWPKRSETEYPKMEKVNAKPPPPPPREDWQPTMDWPPLSRKAGPREAREAREVREVREVKEAKEDASQRSEDRLPVEFSGDCVAEPEPPEPPEPREAASSVAAKKKRKVGKTYLTGDEILRQLLQFVRSMPFDSWGAYVYCFEHKSELLKVTQNSNSRFEVKLTIPAVFLYLFKLEQEKERWLESSSNKDEAKAVLAHKLVDLLLQQGVISDRVAEGGTLNLPKQPTMPPKVWKSSFPTSGHGGKLKATRDQRLRLRASQEDGEDGVKLFILEETWGLATTLPAEHSYQLTLDDTEFRLEVTSAEWTNEHVDVVLKFNLEVLGSGDFEVLLVKVKDGKIDLDAMKVRKADDRPPPQVRDLMHKMDRLSWWELVRKKAPVVPAACPLKLHKIFDEPQAHEKQEFQEDVYCMAKLGKDCLRLMAAVTEYDRLSKAKDSKARDALLKKVEDYLDPERIADLMARSPLIQLGTKSKVSQQDAAEMFFALLGAHKLESDMFTLIRLWEWFVADEHNKCERSLDPAKKYTAGCPRYLGRTPSYMEFGEVDPKDGSALHLKVRFEDCDDAFYRWNGPNAEELRPGLYDGKREWRPCPWDPILGTFCSPSMKLSNGDPRPLPNKVSAWLRGRSMKKLVSIKHSMESTPPYFYLREEEHETDKVEQLIVVYRKIGEVCYRRSAHGGLGEEIYEGQVYPLSFSENKKTLVSQAMPGWALPRKVVTWLLEKRSLPDLIPGRKKSASDQISTQEKKAGFMTSRNEKVWVEAKALTSGRGHIFQVEEGGMWKALSYSEEKKEWVFNVRKAQEEEIVPCEAIAYIYEKIDDSAKLNTPTVRRYFPEASGTAVAEIEQQTDHRFYELSLLAEALTHCSAGSSIVKPNDHLAFVGEAALKCFVSEKAIAEVAFNAHLVVKEGSVSGKTFCAPASFTLPKKELKSPESESKSPKSDKGDSSPPLSLKETLKRRRLACCNHVSYASSCVKNELHKNINHTSEQLKESISIFAKKQAKGKVAALVKLGAPKVLGDTQLATIGSITMDSDNLEAESLMAKHYKESNDTFYKELLQDAEIPHFSKFSFEDGKSMQDTLKALDHDMVKDQISLAPWLLSADPEVDRNEINKLKYCTDLMLLEVENPKGENELIACSSPRAMLLNVALQRRQEGGSSDEDAGEQNEGSGDQDAGQSESDRRPTEHEGAIYCKPCKMWLNGPTQWADHEIGKKHRKAVRRQQAAKHAGCEEEDEQPRPIPAEFGKGPRKDERSEAEQGEGNSMPQHAEYSGYYNYPYFNERLQ